MRVLVCGSRGWRDLAKMRDRLARLPDGSVIVNGDAAGADRLSTLIAGQCGFMVERNPADWTTYGRRAGYLRNLQMLDTKPDLVLAFWDGQSPGTKHTIDEARRREIPVEVIS